MKKKNMKEGKRGIINKKIVELFDFDILIFKTKIISCQSIIGVNVKVWSIR